LREAIGLSGTPFSLFHSSSRTRGVRDAYRVRIPLTGATNPVGLLGVRLEITVAGQSITRDYPVSANLEDVWLSVHVSGSSGAGSCARA
jgi:hypothetical protein